MIQIPTPDREKRDATATDASEDRPGWGAAVRKLLAGLAIIGLAYFVARNFGPREPLASDGSEPGAGGEAEADVRGEAGEQTAVDENFVGESEQEDEDYLAEDRSDEEIEERGTEDVQETPAEPGEMNVEEDVVEDVVDDEGEGESEES